MKLMNDGNLGTGRGKNGLSVPNCPVSSQNLGTEKLERIYNNINNIDIIFHLLFSSVPNFPKFPKNVISGPFPTLFPNTREIGNLGTGPLEE
jgi:hypothetical protein